MLDVRMFVCLTHSKLNQQLRGGILWMTDLTITKTMSWISYADLWHWCFTAVVTHTLTHFRGDLLIQTVFKKRTVGDNGTSLVDNCLALCKVFWFAQMQHQARRQAMQTFTLKSKLYYERWREDFYFETTTLLREVERRLLLWHTSSVQRRLK